MPEMTEAYDWRGRAIVDANGERIGRIDQVHVNPKTDMPEWALVDRGLFGRRSTFVPVGSASPTGEDVQVEVSKAQVKSAPVMEGDATLSSAEEAELLRHYDLDGVMTRTPLEPKPSDESHEVVLDEEQLVIEKLVVATERVRIGSGIDRPPDGSDGAR